MNSRARSPRSASYGRTVAALRVGYSKTRADIDRISACNNHGESPSRVSACPESRAFFYLAASSNLGRLLGRTENLTYREARLEKSRCLSGRKAPPKPINALNASAASRHGYCALNKASPPNSRERTRRQSHG